MSSSTIDFLVKKVNSELELGYIPIGGIAFNYTLNLTTYLQAMVKPVVKGIKNDSQ